MLSSQTGSIQQPPPQVLLSRLKRNTAALLELKECMKERSKVEDTYGRALLKTAGDGGNRKGYDLFAAVRVYIDADLIGKKGSQVIELHYLM